MTITVAMLTVLWKRTHSELVEYKKGWRFLNDKCEALEKDFQHLLERSRSDTDQIVELNREAQQRQEALQNVRRTAVDRAGTIASLERQVREEKRNVKGLMAEISCAQIHLENIKKAAKCLGFAQMESTPENSSHGLTDKSPTQEQKRPGLSKPLYSGQTPLSQ